jgi:precorrin-2/cobalt-factor-2 C20-methyltransferase
VTHATYGVLYGIGLGPGDPELITIKGHSILQRVSTVFVPVSEASDASVALTIASGLLRPEQAVVPLVFAMRRSHVEREAAWRTHCDCIALALANGADAAFLTEGDPLTYSTFAHLAAMLRETHPEVTTVTVPGVTSFAAAAAVTGIPLADARERLAVLPGPYERASLEASLRAFDSLVLMKISSGLEVVLEALDASGRAGDATFVERCGWPDEHVVTDVSTLRGQHVDYFSLMLVRRTQTSGHR